MGAASSRMESGMQGWQQWTWTLIWAAALPLGTSSQKAELKALTQALKLPKGAIANIYTDSRWDY
jgi:ribonuclease HI